MSKIEKEWKQMSDKEKEKEWKRERFMIEIGFAVFASLGILFASNEWLYGSLISFGGALIFVFIYLVACFTELKGLIKKLKIGGQNHEKETI